MAFLPPSAPPPTRARCAQGTGAALGIRHIGSDCGGVDGGFAPDPVRVRRRVRPVGRRARVIAWRIPLAVLASIYGGILVARDRQIDLMRNSIVAAAFVVCADVVAVLAFGLLGAAVVSIAGGALTYLLNARSVRRAAPGLGGRSLRTAGQQAPRWGSTAIASRARAPVSAATSRSCCASGRVPTRPSARSSSSCRRTSQPGPASGSCVFRSRAVRGPGDWPSTGDWVAQPVVSIFSSALRMQRRSPTAARSS